MFEAESNKVQGRSNGFSEFCFLSNALSAARIHPLRLNVPAPDGHGLPPVFDSSPEILQLIDIFISAFHGLRSLDMVFNSRWDVATPVVYNDLRGLGRLINLLSGLEELKLDMSIRSDRHYDYDQIFGGIALHLPKLHTFSLHNMAINTKSLVGLFAQALPGLQTLSFEFIELLDGQWDWIFEFMHRSMHLRWTPSGFVVSRR